MFGGSKNKHGHGSSVETLIGAHATLKGDLTFSGGLYVEGTIHGAVVAAEAQPALLTVSEKGSVRGEVRVPHAVINGQLDGDVYASERIELGPQARIHGNVYYKVMEMAAGAMITGRMVHTEVAAPKQLPKPEAVKPPREAAA